jgi:primosomal protein N' (replication factor Y)
MYADLIVETKTPRDRQFFTYSIPEDLQKDLKTGSVVAVVFGRRKIRGLVIKIHNNKPSYPTKPISTILTYSFSKERIKTLLWLSKYYFCSPGESLKFFLPPLLIRPKAITEKPAKTIKRIELELSKSQQEIYDTVASDWFKGKNYHLLSGVTGSGKTEIYIKLIEKCLAENGQAIYLLPEIFLASVILKRLKRVFGDDIQIVHSKISKSELTDTYQKFSDGRLKIIVGARSALSFLPHNLKLIIIDEEHDNSFKQEQSPRYDARLLAEKMAEYENCRLILGTATPRIESFTSALSGKYQLLELPDRFAQLLPKTIIVDMRAELKSKNYSVISEALKIALTEVIDQKSQAILFLNRRGLATFVSCRDCGFIELCPNCNIPLVHHLNDDRNILECHQCDYKKPLPSSCSDCGSVYIKSFGTGIQKIEVEVKQLFPKARILRLDSDLKEKEFEAVTKKIHNDEFDILIGTQIIAKGLDLPNVDLVGIISADTALHFPDYHSGEQTFQLITQVSGRAGRRGKQGQAIIQTYWPDNQAVKFAASHSYRDFYDLEVEVRKVFDYPPFKKIVRLISQNEDKDKTKLEIRKIGKILKENGFEVAGPAPAFYKRIRNRYRYHLIVKIDDKDREKLYNLLYSVADKFIIDIDPTNML